MIPTVPARSRECASSDAPSPVAADRVGRRTVVMLIVLALPICLIGGSFALLQYHAPAAALAAERRIPARRPDRLLHRGRTSASAQRPRHHGRRLPCGRSDRAGGGTVDGARGLGVRRDSRRRPVRRGYRVGLGNPLGPRIFAGGSPNAEGGRRTRLHFALAIGISRRGHLPAGMGGAAYDSMASVWRVAIQPRVAAWASRRELGGHAPYRSSTARDPASEPYARLHQAHPRRRTTRTLIGSCGATIRARSQTVAERFRSRSTYRKIAARPTIPTRAIECSGGSARPPLGKACPMRLSSRCRSSR